MIAIAKPAPWAATCDDPARAELPRVDWSSCEAVPEPQPVAFALTGPEFRPLPALRTHCPQGHPYDEANTYHHPRAGRQCRICMAARSAAHAAGMKRLRRPRPTPPPPTTSARGPVMPVSPARPLPPPDTDLARAKARIAARHGVEPCTMCGTPRGAREGCSDRPYRDPLGRCGACHEANVLREQLGRAG
jgi:hypothetical protein